jgi:hypothetical protein
VATSLRAHGIRAELPSGWEGRITKLAASAPKVATLPATAPARLAEVMMPFAHFANMALPAKMDSFGGGAVERLGDDKVLICLVEYSPECLGTALFSGRSLPRKLSPRDFHRRSLQRILPGQTGSQTFFTESARPFCLYVVAGSFLRVGSMVRQVNSVLRGIQIEAGAS